MQSARSVGRLIGVLLLLQMAAGAVMNFAVMRPLTGTPPGYLVNAAANSLQVTIASLMGIAAGLLSLAVAVIGWPIFRRYGGQLAIWLLALSIASLALSVVESAAIMSMLSLSQQYTQAAGADEQVYQIAAKIVNSARYWAHYTNLLFGGLKLLAFFTILFRCRLVPGILAGAGIATTLIQIIGVTLPFFGNPVNFYLLTPMGLVLFVLVVWLLVKGFEEQYSNEIENPEQ